MFSFRPPLLTLLILASTAATTAVGAAAGSRPNVVIFLADDAGWGDYSQNGNQMLRTPNIDSIAKGGVTLDRFYVCLLYTSDAADE